MRQNVYTMFISNNRENLLKHQRGSKYYENDCSFKVAIYIGDEENFKRGDQTPRLTLTFYHLFVLHSAYKMFLALEV